MPSNDLALVGLKFVNRLDQIERLFRDTLVDPDPVRARLTRTSLLVRLYAEWELFCEHLIVSSAYRSAKTAQGLLVRRAAGVRDSTSMRLAIGGILSPSKGRYRDPKWGFAPEAINIVRGLAPGNSSTIVNALGASISPANRIRIARNFMAHRNPGTARQVAVEFGQPLKLSQLDALMASVGRPGASTFSTWIDDLCDVAIASIQ